MHISEIKNELADRLRQHVFSLAGEIGERNTFKPKNLKAASRYIQKQLKAANILPQTQVYEAAGEKVENVFAVLPGSLDQVVVVGAHYDTAYGTPGADDNASAVALLLELAAYQQQRSKRHFTYHFVFFTLEEPPFFRTHNMGSYKYAEVLANENIPVNYMLCLESLGYFSHERIQNYPMKVFHLLYPGRGDFLGVVGKFSDFKLIRKTNGFFKKRLTFPVKSFSGPANVPGVDFSDHMNFWKFGFPAIMLTDTAFYRNKHYHQATDKPSTLDYQKMAEISLALRDLENLPTMR